MSETKFEDALHEYKTPFYLFDTDILNLQIQKIRKILGEDVELCYAMKANPFIVKDLEKLVDSFEVCSPGEFAICERAGINMKKIVMSGVNKRPEEIEYALKQYGGSILYTVESLSHWQILCDCTKNLQIPVQVLLRLTSGNQFGMDEMLIREIIAKGTQEFITIEGIQFFSGTQKKSLTKLEKELNLLDAFCRELKEEYDFTVKKIEYGPGLPISYFEEDKNEEDSILHGLAGLLENLTFRGRITLEMGRFIAAPCGSYVTTVVDMKTNKGESYCIVDGGIHQLNYYGQMLAMKTPPLFPFHSRKGNKKEWTVCGSLCTVSDVLVKHYPIEDLQLGDPLIFQKAGAYSVTEGMALFLSRDLPKVLLYSEKDHFRLARPGFQTDAFNYFQS